MSLITEKDVSGFSAVHYAAKKGDIKVWRNARLSLTRRLIKLLFLLSASRNVKTDQWRGWRNSKPKGYGLVYDAMGNIANHNTGTLSVVHSTILQPTFPSCAARVYINTQKKTLFGRYLVILTSRLVNNLYIFHPEEEDYHIRRSGMFIVFLGV